MSLDHLCLHSGRQAPPLDSLKVDVQLSEWANLRVYKVAAR
jgi:hypothetical protein